MIDVGKHKFFLVSVLKEIYSDIELASRLGFKGGTALMLFHGLPRFSVDLDFNLLGDGNDNSVYDQLRTILTAHGAIRDEAQKRHGMLLVLNYEDEQRNLKVEISNRSFPDEYELKDYLGISMQVMKLEHMFTHKLVALLDRSSLTSRDVFDCWFYMKRQVPLVKAILDARLTCTFEEHMNGCIEAVKSIRSSRILDGMGELMDADLKKWVREHLTSEFATLAAMYREMRLVQ